MEEELEQQHYDRNENLPKLKAEICFLKEHLIKPNKKKIKTCCYLFTTCRLGFYYEGCNLITTDLGLFNCINTQKLHGLFR